MKIGLKEMKKEYKKVDIGKIEVSDIMYLNVLIESGIDFLHHSIARAKMLTKFVHINMTNVD